MEALVTSPTSDQISQLVSAVSVPLLVVDYTPIIDRYRGLTLAEIESRLEVEEELIRLPPAAP